MGARKKTSKPKATKPSITTEVPETVDTATPVEVVEPEPEEHPGTEAVRAVAETAARSLTFDCFACTSTHTFTAHGPRRQTCACGIIYQMIVTPAGNYTIEPVKNDTFRARVEWKRKNS